MVAVKVEFSVLTITAGNCSKAASGKPCVVDPVSWGHVAPVSVGVFAATNVEFSYLCFSEFEAEGAVWAGEGIRVSIAAERENDKERKGRT